MRVGDLITVKTIGWDKRYRKKYQNRAGIITKITDYESFNNKDRMGDYRKIYVDFGDGEIEVSESRVQLLVNEQS